VAAMSEEHKISGYDQAFGETIASIPAVRGVIDEAARKLGDGESEEAVLAWLLERARN